MDTGQKIQKTLDGKSGAPAPVLCPNGGGLYSLIPLTQGKFAIVDAEDYEWLNQWKWYATKDGNTYYVVRNSLREKGKQTQIIMHRVILGLKPNDGKQTDHKNHNGLDNRKCNVRVCSKGQNQQNRRHQKGTSKYKGVSWDKRDKKWQAYIKNNNKAIHIGYFTKELKAAKAYDKKAKELFGEFAYTNF